MIAQDPFTNAAQFRMQINLALHAEAQPLVERCLAKEPGQRPATAELLAELEGADLAASWLPAPIVEELSQRVVQEWAVM